MAVNKPNNYDTTQVYGEFEPLELGGHICKIIKVEEVKARTNKDMIAIYLDIAQGRQKDYYSKMYKGNTREQKKWGCIVYQLLEDGDGNTNRGFKTFTTAVEKSNSGFQIVWGEMFCESLKGKLIGGVFGREQYKKQNGELAWATKCFSFRTTEAIINGVDIPKDREYKEKTNAGNNYYAAESAEDDDDLPF